MNLAEKLNVLNVLNSLEVIESQGGEDAYILVSNDEENLKQLNNVGVSTETINKYGNKETFCILTLAFSENIANQFQDGKLVWNPSLYAVYDTSTHDINFFGDYEEAELEYEAAKEAICEDAVTGDEMVYIFEVKKVANLVKDEDRKDDPAKHGYDFWVKWQDNEQ